MSKSSIKRRRLPEPMRYETFYNRVVRLVVGCMKNTSDAHGEPLPASVGKRVAAMLWAELTPGRPLADLLPPPPGSNTGAAEHEACPSPET